MKQKYSIIKNQCQFIYWKRNYFFQARAVRSSTFKNGFSFHYPHLKQQSTTFQKNDSQLFRDSWDFDGKFQSWSQIPGQTVENPMCAIYLAPFFHNLLRFSLFSWIVDLACLLCTDLWVLWQTSFLSLCWREDIPWRRAMETMLLLLLKRQCNSTPPSEKTHMYKIVQCYLDSILKIYFFEISSFKIFIKTQFLNCSDYRHAYIQNTFFESLHN